MGKSAPFLCAALFAVCALVRPAFAGPPFLSDDPEPTEYRHYEIYVFASGTKTRDGEGGAFGLDFNYGAGPDLQLTLAVPMEYDHPIGTERVTGLGNVELAAKYRFLHQAEFGWDVSVFPRLFLPSGSHAVGNRHAAFLLPIWVGREWGDWSTFGGGGYVFNRGGGSRDFTLMGWALARQVLPNLQVGVEIYHQSPDEIGGLATTSVGLGIRYDLNDHFHLLAYGGPGIQNAAQTNQNSWYASGLLTF
jgi:hypothetical protein